LKRQRGSKLGYVGQYVTFLLASFFYLASRSLTRRYDLVHVHNMPDVLVFSALIPRLLGAKVLLDLHDPMPELMMTIFGLERKSRAVRLLCWLEKRSMACAHAVLTVNIACKRIFSSRSCSPDKISVVMNAPDESIFALRDPSSAAVPASGSEKPFVIMYHGSLVERHGLDIAVTALGLIKSSIPKAELRVYGRSTAYLEKTLNSVTDPALRTSIHCLGGKDLPQIAEAIRECDVGVIPNQRNVFTELNTPTRIFEYLALGKPVIAPRTAGIRDYFNDDSLIFFELGNALDLAQKIEYVFHHPEEAGQIAKRGQRVYLAHTWSEERRTLVNLTGELLGS